MSICNKLEKVRDDLKFMVDLTRTEHIEHGANICIDKKGELLLASKISGDDWSLEVPDCPLNTDKIGFFHTHPGSASLAPSNGDLYYGYLHNERVICTGNEHGAVVCAEFGRRIPPNLGHSAQRIIDNAVITGQEEQKSIILGRQPDSIYERAFPTDKTLKALEESSWREASEKPVINELIKRGARICQIQL